MLCGTCYGMLRGQQGRQWRGTFDLHFDHHKHARSLETSAEMGCCICRVLWEEHQNAGLDVTQEADQDFATRAFLSEVLKRRGAYRLDFKMGDCRLGTFFLERRPRIYTPLSTTTRGTEALQLARHWIKTCMSPAHPTCPDEDFDHRPRAYPSRLIELPSYDSVSKRDGPLRARLVITNGANVVLSKRNRGRTTGRTTASVPPMASPGDPLAGNYVTLSHRWDSTSGFLTLRKNNLAEFQDPGILLSSESGSGTLSRALCEAIDFAARVGKDVRYIWIDALCIIQDDEEDWRNESVKMYEVYRNSFCNISVTAEHMNAGLYCDKRDPSLLWEDEVNLNTDGIPKGRDDEKYGKRLPGTEPLVRRCRIQDAFFWNRLVDDAPVNRRAWVLQERLLAPRVLHFCHDQLAWECRHLDAAESLPDGVPDLEIKAGEVAGRERLKAAMPQEYGPRLLVADASERSIAAHELWKRIVERYSTTGLSEEKDKLVAIAGIAALISTQIGRGVTCIAGMWEKWLASQLLWRVNPSYRDGILVYLARRPSVCRAPSFSWAAVKAPHGVKCGATAREDDMLISVNAIHCPVRSRDAQLAGVFSRLDASPNSAQDADTHLIKGDCYLDLSGEVRPVAIMKVRYRGRERYRWKLLSNSPTEAQVLSSLYLDSPVDEEGQILGVDAGIICIPARKDQHGSIHCLMLKRVRSVEDDIDGYRRIGLAIVPEYQAAAAAISSQRSDGRGSAKRQEHWTRIRLH
ncbi:HET-domain-containing protein [Teratosphaeria nubilosa]|uniref:HET-domain-containing protein n=1 Tax=Teratosphaeria nubilosa TaxID=161662 RepID=A0A6G1L078_9PEZI|nr:HET-domain-containing protein [Teratosphaeria nubilosa]